MKSCAPKVPRTPMVAKIKPKVCRNKACADKFIPSRPLQVACCIGCSIIVGRDRIKAEAAKVAKADRAVTKQKLEAIKPRSKWLAEAQAAVNAYVRQRDAHLPCISCGRQHQGQYHAGHFKSVGAHPELRFSELNIHKQCSACNNHLGGNALLYRQGLLARHGEGVVEFLEGPHAPVKYTIADAKAIKATYMAKLKQLQRERE